MVRNRFHHIFICACATGSLLFACGSDDDSPTKSDTTKPRVIATSPSAGETQVRTNGAISVTFSEPIDPESVVLLVNGAVRGPVSVIDSVVTMTLDHPLFQKSEYDGGIAAGVKDLAGNRMDSAYVWSFTTGFGPLGEQWIERTSPTTNPLNFVTRGTYDFLAVGADGTMLTSEDGIAWTASGFHPDADQLWSAYPIGERYVVTGSPGTVLASNVPGNWSQDTLTDTITNLYDMWVGLDGIYLVGTGGVSGTDGILVKYEAPTNWTSVNLGPGLTPRSITRSGITFVIAGDSGLILTSTNGTVWTDHSMGKLWGDLARVRWSEQSGKFFAVGSAIISSSDGTSWAQHTFNSDKRFRDISWTTITIGATTYALYCAVGDSGKVATSEDGVNWTPQVSGVTGNLRSIARGMVPTRFVVVGDAGLILTSE